MPVNANTLNTRVTDENLEKKFRETFRSQGGAELITDLYAQGVVVPIVDFTDAATGSVLRQDLQTAFAYGGNTTFNVNNTATQIIATPGFWQIDGNYATSSSSTTGGTIQVSDGLSTKDLWKINVNTVTGLPINKFIIFVRTGESVSIIAEAAARMTGTYRQIADVYGNLVNPVGFVSQ